MATYRHTIEVEARFVDNLSGEADSASRSITGVGKSAKKAKEDVDRLGKSKASPDVDIDTSKFTRSMDRINRLLDKFKRIHTAALNIKDSGSYQKLKKITDTVEGLTKKTWSVIVKVKDIAMAPFNAVRRVLFNIQTLATAIFAGIAAKTAIINPINVADAYSSAKIGFSTLLGESGGQRMMDQLDQFAKATPFKTTNVIANAQKMMAMGWGTETLIEDMEVIGNAAAATGKLDQGLESIVRALSQIKTKGKLSSEELNQLSEAGIAAKAMLAEELGYGTGDSGIAKMSEDLEAGAIGSEKAIQALLAGMKKYDGMMDSMANETVEGLIAQMQDAFEINVTRKWGQGLQDGAKRGFGTVIELLDRSEAALEEFGDMLYEIGHTASNWVADKFENMVSRVLNITDTFEFKNASLKEKVSLLWNGVIVDPIKEWWEGGGREKTVKTAGEVGEWIGETLTKGLLAVFGVTDFLKDDGGKLGAGAEIAKSFSDGFRENFDASAVTDKLVEAIGNVWGALPPWAKILLGVYGGSKLAIGGMNLISGAAGFVEGAKNLIGGFNIASSALPHLTSSGSGILGLLGKTGVAMGASTATGSVLLGGGTIAGGITAAAGLGHTIKSGYDSYKAFQAGDKTTGKAELARATGTGAGLLAGAGIGAKAGAAIGAMFGGVGAIPGAIIGAGLGTAIGWFAGDKIAKNIEAASFEAEGLKDAFKDAETAEEKAAVQAEALYNNAKRHFGEIKLSMEEISLLVDKIVWGDDLPIFEQFTTATNSAKASLESLKTASASTDKWMWKAGLRVKFDDDEKESLVASFTDYFQAAEAYIENKHYEFSTSASLLLDLESEQGKSIINNGNAFYAQLTEQLNSLTSDLSGQLSLSLEDGIIDLNEEKEIVNLQTQIADILEKVSNAETAAELELLKVKWGKGNLDADSFTDFMDQMETTINERIAAADEAFKVQVSNLALRFPDGGAEYDAALQALVDGYTAKVSGIKADVMDVELNIIGEAYAAELGDNAAELLRSAIEYALVTNTDPVNITDETLSKLLQVDVTSLEGKTAENIRLMLSKVHDQVGTLEVDADVLLKTTAKMEPQNTIDPKPEDFDLPDSKPHSVLWKITGKKQITPFSLGASDFGIRSVYNASPTVTISPVLNYLRNNAPKQEFRGGFVGGASSAIEGFATGGFVRGGARLVKVAEEGTPEAIIPLGNHRRQRGLDLWMKTGEMLGVRTHDQGIRFNSNGALGNSVMVDVGGVHVSIQVDAGGSDNVAEVIKAQGGEIAETVAEMLAAELSAQFANTPAKGGVA